MHLRNAIKQLRLLAAQGPYDLAKYAQAHALLDGFESENTDLDGGMINSFSNEKILEVRTSFQTLCGIGEDGVHADKAHEILRSSLHALNGIVAEDGLSLEPPGSSAKAG